MRLRNTFAALVLVADPDWEGSARGPMQMPER